VYAFSRLYCTFWLTGFASFSSRCSGFCWNCSICLRGLHQDVRRDPAKPQHRAAFPDFHLQHDLALIWVRRTEKRQKLGREDRAISFA
jgi:hypothetical protein